MQSKKGYADINRGAVQDHARSMEPGMGIKRTSADMLDRIIVNAVIDYLPNFGKV